MKQLIFALAAIAALSGCVKNTPGGPTAVAKGTPTPAPRLGTAAINGAVAVKNFSLFYHALRLCTGVTPDAATVAYYQNASLILTQNAFPGSVNDAVIQTGIKLAAFFADAFIKAELAKTPVNRVALTQVNTAMPSTFNSTVVNDVVSKFIPMCLNRPATADDQKDANEALGGFVVASTSLQMTNSLLVVLTGILGSSEMISSN